MLTHRALYVTFVSRFFFVNDAATAAIYTLSHTTLFRSLRPIQRKNIHRDQFVNPRLSQGLLDDAREQHLSNGEMLRSEEHTSELQSQFHLVCRLLLEKKKQHLDAFAAEAQGAIDGFAHV